MAGTSTDHSKVSCISYRWTAHETKVTNKDLLMPYHQKAFFGSLKRSPVNLRT